MPSQNLDAIEELFAAWGRGEFMAALPFDENVTFVVRPEFPEFTVLVGLERLGRYMAEFFAQFESGSLTMTATRLREAGDTVVADVTQRGEGRASGLDLDVRFYMLVTFRGGTVVRIESIMDETAALEAAGLPAPS